MYSGLMPLSLPGSRKALIMCLCALGVGVSCHRAGTPAPRTLRPLNVVVITIDPLASAHLHCYGDEKIETPTLDGVAQSGVLFENAVAQTPLTPPSHASIFTGLNPPTHRSEEHTSELQSPRH